MLGASTGSSQHHLPLPRSPSAPSEWAARLWPVFSVLGKDCADSMGTVLRLERIRPPSCTLLPCVFPDQNYITGANGRYLTAGISGAMVVYLRI